MVRLPTPGSDNGTWGDILNDFLLQTHHADGQLKDNIITSAQIADGTVVTASLEPAVQDKIDAAAPAADPTFTGTVTVPTPVNPTDAATKAYVDSNVPSSIQTALDLKLDKAGDTVTGQMLLTATTGNSLVVDTSTLTVDATNHRVGIGTASPAAALQVIGRTRLYGGPEVLPSDLVEITANNESVSDHTTGLRTTTDFNPSVASLSLRALSGSVSDNVTSTQAIGLMRGMDFAASHNGAGTIGELTGLLTYTTARNVGNVTNLYGAYLRQGTLTGASGTVNTLYGARIENLKQAGTINNAYGLYIDNVNQGGALNYAIYSGGGQSYFAGNVGVKNLSPAVPLDVTGEARVSVAGTDPTSVVTVDGTQTLTNKTLASPVITNASANKTGAYTITAADAYITADATSGAFNITLPTAVGKTGQAFTVKRTNSGSNVVTVNTTSSQTIDGVITWPLTSQNATVTVESDGANWQLLAGYRNSVDVQTLIGSGTSAVTGTWTKPPGARIVQVIACCGGGGGASGRRGGANSSRCGGGGGGGGAIVYLTMLASDLGATESIRAGGGGAGAAAVTTDDTNGNNGGPGTSSYIISTGFMKLAGANSAGGGTISSGSAGAAWATSSVGENGGSGGAASSTGGTGGGGTAASGGTGGGAGGGITSGNVSSNGGNGGNHNATQGGNGGASAGANGSTTTSIGGTLPSVGGGGGSGNANGAGGNGGNGATNGFGGGGGGGGASLNGFNSGAGGNGSPGYIIITTYC